MAPEQYDAIVVGARCAGSPTAMLLARKGYKVLVVDRATFPSDTLSTHILHPPGVAGLKKWGLLDRLTSPILSNRLYPRTQPSSASMSSDGRAARRRSRAQKRGGSR
jgi:flavin-dependent dehydrogenase